MSYTALDKCLVCNSRNLYQYLSFGMQPAANNLVKEVKQLKTYPLEVRFCQDCTHNQLSVAVDPKELYTDYKYVSGTTETLKRHFEELVKWSLGFGHFKDDFFKQPWCWSRDFRVLEIGCNDGTLLSLYKQVGIPTVGIDPAANLQEFQKEKGLQVIPEFWDKNIWYKLEGTFSLILGLNVFAHNPNPYEFLIACGKVLQKDGRVVLEMPLYKNTVQAADFGQIYHEHINYFSVASMAHLVERALFYIDDVLEFPKIHGGTVRFVLKRGLLPHCQKVRDMIRQEQIAGMADVDTYQDFAFKISDNIVYLQNTLLQFKAQGFKIIGYGASAKAATLLNIKSISFWESNIDFFVDDNPLKHGYFIPGTKIRIYSPDSIPVEYKNLAIVCGAHNFKQEIKERLKKKGIQGKLIHYTPTVEVEDI